MLNKQLTRRNLLVRGAAAAAVLPLGGLLAGVVRAEELPIVDANDPTAIALGYSPDATKVDVAKYPKRAGEAGANQFCHNCQLALGEPKDGHVACGLFPGKRVNVNGWCNAWVQKAG